MLPRRDPPRVPQSRVEHATAVEGQRRKQVEREQDEVRVTEPGRRPHRARWGVQRRPARRRAHPARAKRGVPRSQPGTRRPGPRKRALELGDSTEEPEVDAFDLDALSLGLQSVAELVQQERGEEERAAATANAMYSPSEKPGFWEGKTADARDQTMSAKTTSQLQLRPIRIPAIRPS